MIRSLINGFYRKRTSGDEWGCVIISVTGKKRARPRLIFLELKANVHNQKVMNFEHIEYDVLRYRGRLCH